MFEVIADPALRAAHEQVDWELAGLGRPSSWSPTLRGAADLVWSTKYPAALFWGPELVMIYNAAYAPLIGDKHPSAVGAAAAGVFPEAWADIGPLFESVLEGAPATWTDDALVPLLRRGYLEDCWFSFSYSPVHGPGGEVLAVIDLTAETTRQVLDRRRWALLAGLNTALADVEDVDQLRERVSGVLDSAPWDVHDAEVRLAAATADPVPDLDGPCDEQSPRAGRVGVALPELGPAGGEGGPAAGRDELVVAVSDRLPFDAAYRDFLRLVAGAIGQALVRLHSREVERRAAAVERGLSEALQRSLLTPPVVAAPLEVAVRYRPAAALVQIGGDWYDAFTLPDGTSVLVVGDVTGHDRMAAAAMAQLRSLLRGTVLAQSGADAALVRPGEVLAALDRAIDQLELDVLATVVVACVEPAAPDRAAVVRWSSAGHPPPLLAEVGRAARVLDDEPDLLIGVDPDTDRQERVERLPPGGALLLYTDGLVEHRGESLQVGLDRLAGVAGGAVARSAEAWCDAVLAGAGAADEDDVALLAVRHGGR